MGRKTTLFTAADLIGAGLLAPARAAEAEAVAARYAVAVSPAMVPLIDTADPADPIGRQFLPDASELETRSDEIADPIGDHLKSPLAGLVHRYPDRVLLKLTGVCPVYCRFCFRREMVGPDKGEAMGGTELAAALAYIAARPAIWEVILTGGDPLILSPRRIGEVSARLGAINHVKVLRWHSRVPVVAPERITDALVAALTAGDKAAVVGIHANHPRELTDDARAALVKLGRAGVMLLSQTVLLAGVNDAADTLEALFRAFVEAGVKPYYLHHLDRSPGTAHFRVPIARGQALMAEVGRRLSGVALPRYVLDLPGAHGKVAIEPGRIVPADDGWRITDSLGQAHTYLG